MSNCESLFGFEMLFPLLRSIRSVIACSVSELQSLAPQEKERSHFSRCLLYVASLHFTLIHSSPALVSVHLLCECVCPVCQILSPHSPYQLDPSGL